MNADVDFSTLICNKCVDKLKEIYDFRALVIQSHESLCFLNVNGTGTSNGNKIQNEDSMDYRTTDDENYCIVCNKQFSNANRLLSHQIKQHFIRNDLNALRPYMCSICDKSYTTQGSLNIHKLIHSGECIFFFFSNFNIEFSILTF